VLSPNLIRDVVGTLSTTACLLFLCATTNGPSNPSILREVTDQNGAVVLAAQINNTDLSITRNTKLDDVFRPQFRAEFFDVFNHANSGQPDNVVEVGRLVESLIRGPRPANPVRHDRSV